MIGGSGVFESLDILNFSMKFFTTILFSMGIFSFLFGQHLSDYEKRVFADGKGNLLNYRILFPKNYNACTKYPLVLFLHGAGERGDNNQAQLTHGGKLFLQKKNRELYPAIVVFPQCPQEDYWAHMVEKPRDGRRWREFPNAEEPGKALGLTMKLLKKLIVEQQVDLDRVYLMGLSMGGMGTFELLARMPETFAAAVPICGGGNLKLAERYAGTTNLWIFLFVKDEVVLPEHSREMYAKLQALGANVRYTEFPDADHNSWDPAFAQPGLLEWLFSHRK